MKPRKWRRKKRRCIWCGCEFIFNPKLKERQKTCGSEECKRRQNLLAQRRWKRRNPIVYRQGQDDWRKRQKEENKGYWKDWRGRHSEYVVRNRVLTRLRRSLFRRKTGLQRKLDILQPFEKQVKFRRYCGLQRKLDRLFRYPSFISLGHERLQGDQERASP